MNFLLAIIILLVAAKLLGEVFERLSLPSLLGELLAGILLGATFLGWIKAGQVEDLATIGVILLLFLIGFNFSIERLKKEGKKGIAMTVLGYIFVTGLMYFIFKQIGLGLLHAILFAVAMAGESTANVIRALVDMDKLHSNVSEVIVSATVVEDFILYTILAFGVALVGAEGLFDVGIGLGKIILFFATFIVMEKVSPKLIKYSEKMRSEEAQFALAFILIVALAYLADALGFAAIVGAFFAGIALAYSPYLKTGSFSPKIASFTYGVFAPIFFAWIGLQVAFSPESFSLIGLGIVFAAVGIKFVGNFLGALITKTGLRESLGAALGLVNLGGDQLLVIIILSQLEIFGDFLTETLLPSVVIVMVVTMFLAPALLKVFFDYYPDDEAKKEKS